MIIVTGTALARAERFDEVLRVGTEHVLSSRHAAAIAARARPPRKKPLDTTNHIGYMDRRSMQAPDQGHSERDAKGV